MPQYDNELVQRSLAAPCVRPASAHQPVVCALWCGLMCDLSVCDQGSSNPLRQPGQMAFFPGIFSGSTWDHCLFQQSGPESAWEHQAESLRPLVYRNRLAAQVLEPGIPAGWESPVCDLPSCPITGLGVTVP